ncbi:MAG: hypothetical protein KH936_03755, partial [Neisseria sp.]|nr:hypothetical protein [Neisseria sp.]
MDLNCAKYRNGHATAYLESQLCFTIHILIIIFIHYAIKENGSKGTIVPTSVYMRPLQKSPSPDSRNPNTGFRLFSPLITPDFTQIP